MFVNTIARSLSEIITRLGSAVFWVLVARNLGTTGLGSLAFALSLFALFGNLSNLGLDAVIIRDVAQKQHQSGRYFGHSLILGIFSSMLFAVIMMVSAKLIHPSAQSVSSTYILALTLIPSSVFYWSRTILFAVEKMRYVAVARTVESIFKVGAGAVVIAMDRGIVGIAIVVSLSKVLSALICYLYAVKKAVIPEWTLKKEFFQYLLQNIPSFSLIAIFNSLFWSLSVIMLTKLQGEAAAGIFSAAFKLVDVILAMALAYGQALFPVAARMSRTDPVFLKQLCQKSIKYISILTTLIAVTTFLLADKIILVLYGAEMAAAVPVLQTIIWILVPFAIVPVLAYALTSHILHRYDLQANFYSCITIALLNVILIPRYDAMGAGVALLISCVVFMFIELYWVEKTLFRVVRI
jgi:O-antigen/teichoic acid export membrane protein